MGLRIAATVLATALMGTAAVAPAEARQPSGEPATQAKKKKKAKRKACKKGYVRKTVKVKRTRRVHGKRRRVTVKVKRCVKVKRKTPSTGKPPVTPTPIPQAPAGGALDERQCQSPTASGTYSDPIQVGTITRTVVLRNCAPLTSGPPFNSHYFLFTLASAAPSGSAVASRFNPALFAVSPRVVGAGGVTLLTYLANGFPVGNPESGRAISIAGLGPGTYRLGMEKLSSPLATFATSPYDAIILLNN